MEGPNLTQAGWQSRYLEGRTGWDRGEANPQLVAWLANGEVIEGRILVPGCGRGHEALLLAQAGRAVTAIDYAEAPVKALKQSAVDAAIELEIRQQDLFDYDPEETFDGIYEQTCLCAIDPKLREDYESRLHRWLRPGGELMILFMQSPQPGGPPFHCDEIAMKELFSSGRWRWPAQLVRVEHPAGIYELAGILRRI